MVESLRNLCFLNTQFFLFKKTTTTKKLHMQSCLWIFIIANYIKGNDKKKCCITIYIWLFLMYILREKMRAETVESFCTYSSGTVKSTVARLWNQFISFSCIGIYTEISLNLLYGIILWFICVEESVRTFCVPDVKQWRTTCVKQCSS